MRYRRSAGVVCTILVLAGYIIDFADIFSRNIRLRYNFRKIYAIAAAAVAAVVVCGGGVQGRRVDSSAVIASVAYINVISVFVLVTVRIIGQWPLG